MRPTRLAAAVALVALPLFVLRSFQARSVSLLDANGRMADQHAVISYADAEPRWTPQRGEVAAVATAIASVPQNADAADGGGLPDAVAIDDHDAGSPPPLAVSPPPAPDVLPRWLEADASQLDFNDAARKAFVRVEPRRTTLHFTFGSSIMMDFVKNWLHFVRAAALAPVLVGAADGDVLDFCDREGVPAAAIKPELDVWTYRRRPVSADKVYTMHAKWKYFRHHDSDFLEMGLIKVAFLWELLSMDFSVLISDLDVVWLNGRWPRWMTWEVPNATLPQAQLIALADILVTTDELNAQKDANGGRPDRMSDLNTGVVYFRNTKGALAMVQQWRKSMLAQKGRKDLNENVNDQSLFNQVVRGSEMDDAECERWRAQIGEQGRTVPPRFAITASTRRVFRSSQPLPPCLPDKGCEGVTFTFGTLPMRPFTGGHTWFNQNVQAMAGHELPENEPITVHFTFQFGDTGEYPHGKRQRAREAALWAVDPPEYFTEGLFVAIDGPTYEGGYMDRVYGRFPEWSPQRHMFMDAPQRQAVRDLLGLATALGGIMVMPKLWCHCDRYWGFLTRCRFPHVPNMKFPFGCPQDALYESPRWNNKKVRYREHTFLDNPLVPAALVQNKVTVTVAPRDAAGSPVAPPNRTHVELPYGTPMADVRAAVLRANPDVRLVRIRNADLRRLCRWLGSAKQNGDFNTLARYVLTESSRYCPTEDHGGYHAPGFDWQNPFTAYNCTWGFHSPAPFPSSYTCAALGGVDVAELASSSGGAVSVPSVELEERGNSTTCPRIMLCDYNILPDGRTTKPVAWCNIEGYNGMDPKWLGITRHMLAGMPDGRCPYPPGDRVGMPGIPAPDGHYIGTQ